jgi:hypothetical protein
MGRVNFLVSCPKGTIFIREVDAFANVKGVALLCNMLDEFIQETGVKHVVSHNK